MAIVPSDDQFSRCHSLNDLLENISEEFNFRMSNVENWAPRGSDTVEHKCRKQIRFLWYKDREALYSCIEKFRHAFNPAQSHFQDFIQVIEAQANSCQKSLRSRSAPDSANTSFSSVFSNIDSANTSFTTDASTSFVQAERPPALAVVAQTADIQAFDRFRLPGPPTSPKKRRLPNDDGFMKRAAPNLQEPKILQHFQLRDLASQGFFCVLTQLSTSRNY